VIFFGIARDRTPSGAMSVGGGGLLRPTISSALPRTPGLPLEEAQAHSKTIDRQNHHLALDDERVRRPGPDRLGGCGWPMTEMEISDQ